MASIKRSVDTVSQPWRESPYYAEAEQWTWLFWELGGPFRTLFDRLDTEVILELACGHGRHGEQIVSQAKSLVLVDVVEENIKVCRERFSASSNVVFVVNNGFDFQPIESGSCTGIFSYDAMVHFSPDLVEAYLKDTARVLKPGGLALYHHSNYPAPLDRHYGQNPHARNHMTKDLFADYARRSGLVVVEQVVIPWGGTPDLDCLSLVAR